LGEGQIAELIEDHEVDPGQLISNPALPPIAGLSLETIDEIDDVVEAAAVPERMQLLAIAMARWVLPVPVTADQHGITLLSNEVAAGEVDQFGSLSLVVRGPTSYRLVWS
jgi:hypothetical protein